MAVREDENGRLSLIRYALGASLWSGAALSEVVLSPDGVPRAVSELQALAVRAARGIEDVRALGAAARSVLDEISSGATAAAAPDALFEVEALSGPLQTQVDDATTARVVQLEAEAVAIDALLQLALAEIPEVCTLASSLADDEPGRLSELRGRFDAALATLRAIPPCLQTDLTLRVFALTTAAAGGALAALRSAVVVTETAPPSDIVFSAPSGSQRRRVRPGTAVAFRIAATPDASMRLHHDAEAFAAAVAQRVWAAATLTAPSKALGAAARVTIHIEAVVDIVRDAASGEPCVHVAFTVPAEATLGSTLKLHCLNLAAHPLLPSEGASFTVVPSVGLRVPLDVPRLCVSRNQTPCTSSDGSLWIPGLSEVQRIADDGSTLQVFPTAPLGLSGMLCAVFDHETGLIVIASQNPGLPLIAVRASTGGTAWRATEAPGAVFGLAVLSAAGVVVVGGYSAEPDAISVHRLSDGARLATASVRGMTYLTADQATGAVYASTSRGTIEVLKWDGRALVAVGPFRLAPHLPANTSHNPLCIMPDADRDGGTPTLIVGVQEATDILVFAIDAAGMPGALLRKQNLATGIEVVGLAADPSGCGLVVMDWSSHAARVLPWPLTREFLRRYN